MNSVQLRSLVAATLVATILAVPALAQKRRAAAHPTAKDKFVVTITGTVLDDATGLPKAAYVTEMALFAQAPPIYGGTDQIQRNIIGERVLGLPKEPNNDKVTPFKELPRNG